MGPGVWRAQPGGPAQEAGGWPKASPGWGWAARLLVAQRIDRVEAGGAHRRVDAEEEADRGRDAEGEDHGARRDDRRDGLAVEVDVAGDVRDAGADADTDQAAGHADHDR